MIVPWHDMFALQLPVLEKLLRPVCVYLFLLVGLRLAGKRELRSSTRSIWSCC